MPFARTLQTARNSLQATRINAAAQLRGIAGGMGLQDGNGEGNNAVPPVEGMAGPFGMWNFPILSKIKEGGFGQAAAPGDVGRLGVPSSAAHITAGAGTEVRQRQGGIHIF